jgi:neutral ceramidase
VAEYLVGRGIADITGEPAGVGMLGYGKRNQRTEDVEQAARVVRAEALTRRGSAAESRGPYEFPIP